VNKNEEICEHVFETSIGDYCEKHKEMCEAIDFCLFKKNKK
jgi:hypothetical protein